MRYYATGNSYAGSRLILTSYNISPQIFQYLPIPCQTKDVVVFRLIPRRIEGRFLGDESRAYRQRWRVKWMRIYKVSLLKICCATFKSRILNRRMIFTVAEKPAATSQKPWLEYTGYSGSLAYPNIPHETNQRICGSLVSRVTPSFILLDRTH